jgi:uncharacterized OsmC-like protein
MYGHTFLQLGRKGQLRGEHLLDYTVNFSALTNNNSGIDFAVKGEVNPAQLERAIQLSHEKYCSVWHSMRQDIPLECTSSINPR